MSHFITLVFTRDEDDLEDIMEPYCEEKEVEKYVEYTKEEAIASVREDLEDYKNSIWYQEYIKNPEVYKEKNKDNPGHIDYLENEFPKRLKWTDEECYAYKADLYDDDMKDEKGNLYSDYNPLSKWDWYEVGGRWRKWLRTKEGNVDEAYVSEVLWNEFDSVPFAFIDLNGDWHERGSMGWWAIVSDEKEKDAWQKEFEDYISELDDDVKVLVIDCHI